MKLQFNNHHKAYSKMGGDSLHRIHSWEARKRGTVWYLRMNEVPITSGRRTAKECMRLASEVATILGHTPVVAQ